MTLPRGRRGPISGTGIRPVSVAGALLAALATLAGCGMLPLVDDVPDDVAIVTSAATVADGPTAHAAVTLPDLDAATTVVAPSPTPWASMTTAPSAVPTEPEQTAASTTRTTLTSATFLDVTTGEVVEPTEVAFAPPACYADGGCAPYAAADAAAGRVELVDPPGEDATVVMLSTGGEPRTALAVPRLKKMALDCSGEYCLVQGTASGTHFGTLLHVAAKEIRALPGQAGSAGKLSLLGGPVVAGVQRFSDYGLGPDDAPRAARTWTVQSGALASSGCGTPKLYGSTPRADAALSGPCSGTPVLAGYGAGSAGKIASVTGFVTPDGNIHCGLTTGGNLACTAKKYDFKVSTCSKPTSQIPKDLRGLRVIAVATGKIAIDGCLGYSLIGTPKAKTTDGQLAAGSGFVCQIATGSVSCTSPTGSGFTFSRAAAARK